MKIKFRISLFGLLLALVNLRIQKLETENAGLKQRLEALEKIIRTQIKLKRTEL